MTDTATIGGYACMTCNQWVYPVTTHNCSGPTCRTPTRPFADEQAAALRDIADVLREIRDEIKATNDHSGCYVAPTPSDTQTLAEKQVLLYGEIASQLEAMCDAVIAGNAVAEELLAAIRERPA